VLYELTGSKSPSKNIRKEIRYPQKMAAFQQKATDDMYLHIVAKASLLGVDPKTVYPKQVYLSMRIADAGRAPLLWVNSIATYNEE